MPPSYDLNLADFSRLVRRFAWERSIEAIHLHHSGRTEDCRRPAREVLQRTWSEHTLERGWSDIAQHLTIAPDGTLWTGRDWNRPPCSVPWKNGSPVAGPFMIVLLGNFDGDADPPRVQLDSAIEAIARLQNGIERLRIEFPSASGRLHLHRDLVGGPGYTCPGKRVDGVELAKAVEAKRLALAAEPNAGEPPPFDDDVEHWYQFIATAGRSHGARDEPGSAPDDTRDLPPRDRGCDVRRAP